MIYRVWSTDWIKDPHTEGERLLAAVREAVDTYREEPYKQDSWTVTKATDFLDVSKKSVAEIANEKYRSVRSRYAGGKASEIPMSDIEQTMLKVLAANLGLDKNGLFKETAQHGYSWARQGSTIKQKFEMAYQRLLFQKKITEDEDGKIKCMI